MVIGPYTCKRLGQRSLGSKDKEWKQADGQTDRRTEATALRAVLTRSVKIVGRINK